MAAQAKWQLSGDYFENCNCDVVCPCLVSPAAPLTSRPTEGTCAVALFFHIDKGSYDTTPLDSLNVAVIGHAPGPMGAGNWTIAATSTSARTTNRPQRLVPSLAAPRVDRWLPSHR